jgi:sulfopyruvate decarboxylase subunit alpha
VSSPVDQPAWAVSICAGLRDAGIRHLVHVPDNPTSHILRVLQAPPYVALPHVASGFSRTATIRVTTATREEEAFGIAAGAYLGGYRSAVMLQSSGLGNSLNALTSLLIPYRIPVVMLISMRGEDDEWNPAQRPMGRALRPILDAIGIPHQTLEPATDGADMICAVARRAFDARLPAACLLPRRTTVAATTAAR